METFRSSPVAYIYATLLQNLCPISQNTWIHTVHFCVGSDSGLFFCYFLQENSHLSSEMDAIHPWEVSVSLCMGCISYTSRNFRQIICSWISNLKVGYELSYLLCSFSRCLYWQIFLYLSGQKVELSPLAVWKKSLPKKLACTGKFEFIVMFCHVVYDWRTRIYLKFSSKNFCLLEDLCC